MKLIIVSGRSGSGKSTALHVLEDLGYYCIDNLPIGLLMPLTEEALKPSSGRLRKMAVSIDARNLSDEIANFQVIHQQLVQSPVSTEIIYLDADDQALITRFHATRRKHPLSSSSVSLNEAIDAERALLEPISRLADLSVDTSNLTLYQLRDLIKERVAGRKEQELALLFKSFGYKHGVPVDADFVFDVRCLPNPYWDTRLRPFTGLDAPVSDFLSAQVETTRLIDDITRLLESWLPHFQAGNRSYMTIAIGCTGGQHRSVYVCERLGGYFRQRFANVQVRHSELPSPASGHNDHA